MVTVPTYAAPDGACQARTIEHIRSSKQHAAHEWPEFMVTAVAHQI